MRDTYEDWCDLTKQQALDLRADKCPYCGAYLERIGDYDKKCTECDFKLER